MRLRLPRLPRTIWVLIAGFAIAGITLSIHWTIRGALYPAALSTEEFASLYRIPVDRQPAQKLEWSFASSSYVRAVIEQQDGTSNPWKQVGSYKWTMACTHATFIYKLGEMERVPGRNDYFRTLDLRIGGSTRVLGKAMVQGWSGSNFLFQLPSGEYSTVAQHNDPERVFSITSGNRSYRIRLERSVLPFSTN